MDVRIDELAIGNRGEAVVEEYGAVGKAAELVERPGAVVGVHVHDQGAGGGEGVLGGGGGGAADLGDGDHRVVGAVAQGEVGGLQVASDDGAIARREVVGLQGRHAAAIDLA